METPSILGMPLAVKSSWILISANHSLKFWRQIADPGMGSTSLARKPSVFKLPLTAAALAALTFLATSGCTSFQQQHVSVTPPTSLPAGGVVFVADGAGDFRATSEALRRAIASFVAREGHRPPGSNGLVVDLRQDRDQTNPGCRQW